jgi:hypothetical protein
MTSDTADVAGCASPRRRAPYAVTPALLGHILIAADVLPCYRGVWRSMHLGGHLDVEVARRVWPAWLERNESGSRERTRQN